MEVNLGQFLDENMQYKNEIKVYQKKMKYVEEEVAQVPTSNEIDNLRDELKSFKKHVSQEINGIKMQMSKESKEVQPSLASSTYFRPLNFHVNSREKCESSTAISSDDDHNGEPPSPRTRSRRRKKKAKQLSIVPGLETYSQAVTGEKNSIIFSTSMTRDINDIEFNRLCTGSKVEFNRFRGKKMHHIKNYIKSHLEDKVPDNVLVQGGGNDLPSSKVTHSPAATVAADIIQAGITCKRSGATSVLISSILPRRPFHYQLYRHEVNVILRKECEQNGFIFIDNNNIILKDHICKDGVHLNDCGTELLRSNFLSYLNRQA